MKPHDPGKTKRDAEGQKPEDQRAPFVSHQSLHVHFQGGEEHDIVETHAAEELEARVANEDVQPIFPHKHTGKHHADKMRDAKLAHNDWGKEDDQQHHEEHQRGVCDGKI